jgi:hypothetical protein
MSQEMDTERYKRLNPTREELNAMSESDRSVYCLQCLHHLLEHSDYDPFDGRGPCIRIGCECKGQGEY